VKQLYAKVKVSVFNRLVKSLKKCMRANKALNKEIAEYNKYAKEYNIGTKDV
jgi:hypothetical protein